ncbi:hypothetical protein HET73_03835 [Wolbachia endosymbiont of Atemnus politus]|uniref:hypothetical protein n=1 Tax=Wolbachia endosymbiont of Atemnus politus TaxID=2682840 RepID=UPI0015747712|nr:hypothetical protein [Wolbachia endosymbiont of Atemnus politus]NSM56607.1 hypothetical protein [Wolbachia endosymbiont of Atemnus politus]
MSGLTKEQQELYNNLQDARKNREDITEVLTRASKDDLQTVLTTANIRQEFQNGYNRTETPLGYRF